MSTTPSTYLDHAASTPMLPVARQVFVNALETTGNASSLHATGRRSRKLIEESREQIAAVLGARSSEVVFTSGGTEANNLALKGELWASVEANQARASMIKIGRAHV